MIAVLIYFMNHQLVYSRNAFVFYVNAVVVSVIFCWLTQYYNNV